MGEFRPKDRNYVEWDIVHKCQETSIGETSTIMEKMKIDPIATKLLPGDIIDDTGSIISSPYRNKINIPGVLITSGKTYGRVESKNPIFKNSKLYYKCIPYDKTLPSFIIPYEYKLDGFNKKKSDMYILFSVKNWNKKHPEGVLQQTIGCVDEPNFYYDYQLHCNDLCISANKFSKTALSIIREIDVDKTMEEYLVSHESVCDRRKEKIFSIDPADTKDIDDAMSMIEYNNIIKISIYIANVPQWLNILSLWSQLTSRVATVYMPCMKLPVFPFVFSENLFSLLEGKNRLAFAMDVYIDKTTYKITRVEYKNAVVSLKKNYAYEEYSLLNDIDYKKIYEITKYMNISKEYLDNVVDSHDLVTYWMIFMNNYTGEYLSKINSGIFRSVRVHQGNIEHNSKYDELTNFLKIWKYTQSEYSIYDEQKGHDLIGKGLQAYAQITSPIRRVVDVINMMCVQKHLNIFEESDESQKYLSNWLHNLSEINEKTKKTRKVQNNCELYKRCLTMSHEEKTNLLGYVISIKKNNDSLHISYNVYIPSLKLTSKVSGSFSADSGDTGLILYEKYYFTMHILMDENTFYKKIRLQPNVFSPE